MSKERDEQVAKWEEEKSKRNVQGKAIDLGAGTFTAGTDIEPGIYDATSLKGQGNFVVKNSNGKLTTNEILGNGELGSKKVRVVIADGDNITISGINRTHFEPVTTPLIKEKKEVVLYSGYWVVGQDIGAGRYKAGNNLSKSSNFIINGKSGKLKTNEIISSSGDLGVAEVTVTLEDGDLINIRSSNGIKFTPQ